MSNQQRQKQEMEHYRGIGMAIGMLLFMPVGLVLFILLDNPGMLGVGPGVGVAVGLALGEGLYRRKRRENGDRA
jgi:hypothetical protein